MNVEEARKNPKIWEAYQKTIINQMNKRVDSDSNFDKDINSNVSNVSGKIGKIRREKISNSFGDFDSKLEFTHYLILKDIIHDYKNLTLIRQKRYELLESKTIHNVFTNKTETHKKIDYIADFVILDTIRNEDVAVIDSKGFKTEKFRIKNKLFVSKYNTPILLIQKDTSLDFLKTYLKNEYGISQK